MNKKESSNRSRGDSKSKVRSESKGNKEQSKKEIRSESKGRLKPNGDDKKKATKDPQKRTSQSPSKTSLKDKTRSSTKIDNGTKSTSGDKKVSKKAVNGDVHRSPSKGNSKKRNYRLLLCLLLICLFVVMCSCRSYQCHAWNSKCLLIFFGRHMALVVGAPLSPNNHHLFIFSFNVKCNAEHLCNISIFWVSKWVGKM